MSHDRNTQAITLWTKDVNSLINFLKKKKDGGQLDRIC